MYSVYIKGPCSNWLHPFFSGLLFVQACLHGMFRGTSFTVLSRRDKVDFPDSHFFPLDPREWQQQVWSWYVSTRRVERQPRPVRASEPATNVGRAINWRNLCFGPGIPLLGWMRCSTRPVRLVGLQDAAMHEWDCTAMMRSERRKVGTRWCQSPGMRRAGCTVSRSRPAYITGTGEPREQGRRVFSIREPVSFALLREEDLFLNFILGVLVVIKYLF